MDALGRFSLQHGELLRLDLGQPIGLHCGRGRMWVSTVRPGRDHLLVPGARLNCKKGLILVEGEGEVLVERSRPGRTLLGALVGCAFRRIRLIAPRNG